MSEIKKKRFKPSHVYSIIVTSLVLFMIGIVAMLFMQGKKLADHFKEQIEFTVIIKDNVNEKNILALQKKLEQEPWVKSSKYISKDEAAKIFTKENQEDFKDLLDYNPLFASINLKLNASYTSQDSINAIESRVMANKEAGEFYYERELVSVMNDNFKKIGWVVLSVIVLFIVIAITLIDSTIRLSMYSQRFLIRSMQLVGATRNFITWPFLKRSLVDGIVAGTVAILALLILLNFSLRQIPDLAAINDFTFSFILFLVVLIAGLSFSFISTHFAVKKYLKMKLDELY